MDTFFSIDRNNFFIPLLYINIKYSEYSKLFTLYMLRVPHVYGITRNPYGENSLSVCVS